MSIKTSHLQKSMISAVILAGGRGARMGGINKGLVPLRGRPMISHVIERLSAQVATIIISANHDQQAYRAFGYPVIADVPPDSHGPLAGIYSAMTIMQTDWLACAPCDVPRIPADLIARLSEPDIAQLARVAHDGVRQQSACCLLHASLREPLQRYLESGQHAVHRFLAEQHATEVDFSDQPDAFDNINTREQLQQHG